MSVAVAHDFTYDMIYLMAKQQRSNKKREASPVRTDKWKLNPDPITKRLLLNTVGEYRRLVRALIGVVYTHWIDIADSVAVASWRASAKDTIAVVESLIHPTKKRPEVKYKYFSRAFYKFPSYLRRAAIHNAVGQVSSFVTRYDKWQRGIRNRRDALPPKLTANTGVYPSLYQGQCILFGLGFTTAQVKVFTGTDWIWSKPIPISGFRERHNCSDNQRKSPQLVVNEQACQLSVPFQINSKHRENSNLVLAVDLGINTTATAVVVSSGGTVMHRAFLHYGKDIDHRDQRLKRISKKAKLTGKLCKGFCRGLYRKANHINQQIAQSCSKQLLQIAQRFGVKTIVFERLKGWRPKGGKKRSTLKQRFHGWLHRRLTQLTEMKWTELGGSVDYVLPQYTSKYAYDGSGRVWRNKQNYALAVFATGKRYNADLNGSLNIAARYWYKKLKLGSRNDSEVWLGKNSSQTPRTPVTLSVLWCHPQSL
jgi:IS605 OrfB family transposase